MKFIKLEISGAWLASSPVWEDNRGSFREWFRRADLLKSTGVDFEVKQANISTSRKGVVRGIHYSLATEGQAKWITCVSGHIKDVIVDIRPGSNTFGRHVVVDLKGDSGDSVFVSEGLGHAFVSLAPVSNVAYLVSSTFSPQEEFEINPLDPAIGINWGLSLGEIKLSEKDKNAPTLNERLLQGNLPL